MPEPTLHEGDVGGMLQCVVRLGRAQSVEAEPVDVDSGDGGVALDHFVEPVPGDCVLEHARPVVADRPEEGSFALGAVMPHAHVLLIQGGAEPDTITMFVFFGLPFIRHPPPRLLPDQTK